MSATNYFKVGTIDGVDARGARLSSFRTFFFDEADARSVAAAYGEAEEHLRRREVLGHRGRMTAWSAVAVPGPWADVPTPGEVLAQGASS